MAVDNAHPQAYGDPARIAAQILTGIGFIGGGTVLRHGSSVYGLTTAATLWVAASIGMACGAGMLNIAFIATIFSIFVLVLVRLFEQNILSKGAKNIKRFKIIISCQQKDAEIIYNYIVENFNGIHEVSKKYQDKMNDLISIIAIIDIVGKKPINSLYKKFQQLTGIESVSIQENHE
jgi:putative Mg2+ transporter-C (MgtC) family protein